MKKFILLSAAAVLSLGAYAKTADENAVENYKRSSLYTIILTSDEQNAYYEKETKEAAGANEIMSLAKSFAGTDAKKAANDDNEGSIFALPAKVFADIEIPNQFNDHNLQTRVLNFDEMAAKISDSDIAAAEAAGFKGKKKSKAASIAGGLAKSAAGMDNTGTEINERFDAKVQAVMHKYFNDNHVAELILSKWYDYNPEGDQKWGLATVYDRGQYNFTEDDIKKAADDINLKNKIDQTAFDMIGDTYIMVTNLRFRSYQAIVKETQAAAGAVAGAFGFGGLEKIAGAAASAAAGDGYTVQAVSSLYQLDWNEDANNLFAENIHMKNATLEDLIDAGICKLKYLGTEKSSSNIRQSLFSDKPISDLVKRATARAIDEAIVKLQNSNEQFRTAMPVIGGDGNGTIYAQIGTKEGLNEKDEYELLEKQEDKDGKTFYKSLGSVKPVKGKIWNNAYGAAEEVADNAKASDADKEAVSRGYSEFKGKKGDYKGYYLRLKKKK